MGVEGRREAHECFLVVAELSRDGAIKSQTLQAGGAGRNHYPVPYHEVGTLIAKWGRALSLKRNSLPTPSMALSKHHVDGEFLSISVSSFCPFALA